MQSVNCVLFNSSIDIYHLLFAFHSERNDQLLGYIAKKRLSRKAYFESMFV